jgi:hypothetical protein
MRLHGRFDHLTREDSLIVSVGIVFGARRDVVNLDIVFLLVAPVFVVLVQTAHRAFFDRPFRSALGILARCLALVLGGRIGAEVAVTRRSRGTTTAASVGPRRPSARTRRVPAAPARRGTTGPRTTVSSGARCAGGSVFSRARFTDGERTSFEGLLVESADCRFRDGAIRVINKRETARPAGFPIDGKNYLGGFTDA